MTALAAKPHGHFLAGEAGELAGVSGNTIGQWARWGYIHASQDEGDPHVYAVEDVAEAAVVRALLERGVTHADVRRAITRLREYGDWPLSQAPLATTSDGGRTRLVLRDPDGISVLEPRGWQRVVAPVATEDVHLRLRHSSR